MSAYAKNKPSDVPRTPWWLVLVEGIIAILIGLLFFVNPFRTLTFMVQLLGIYWIAKGLVDIISIFVDRAMWGWKLVAGIVGIVAGALVLQYPLGSTISISIVLVYVLAFSGIFLGLVGLIQAFRGAGWGTGVLGALSIIFGLILLFNPRLAAVSFPWVLGLLGIASGIMAIFGAFGLRRLQKEGAQVAQAPAMPAMQTRAGVVAPAPVTPASPAAVEPSAAGAAAVAATVAASVAPETEELTPAVIAAEPEIPATAPQAPEAEPVLPEPEAALPAAAVVAEAASREQEISFDVAAEAPLAEPEAPHAGEPAEFGGGKFKEDIEYVEGIGPAFGQKLKAINIMTPNDLLARGAAPNGRAEIVELTGISSKLVLEWVNHCDLFRIRGVGSEYADLLEAAGVDTVVELAKRNPANLYLRMIDVNAEKNLVRRIPVQSQVEDWVAQAKLLPRVITY
jgi:uncharacterized membrane protein HdeD (DUF308 family)/predicted flap endonuclease-1-like 5' DNA nuclease